MDKRWTRFQKGRFHWYGIPIKGLQDSNPQSISLMSFMNRICFKWRGSFQNSSWSQWANWDILETIEQTSIFNSERRVGLELFACGRQVSTCPCANKYWCRIELFDECENCYSRKNFIFGEKTIVSLHTLREAVSFWDSVHPSDWKSRLPWSEQWKKLTRRTRPRCKNKKNCEMKKKEAKRRKLKCNLVVKENPCNERRSEWLGIIRKLLMNCCVLQNASFRRPWILQQAAKSVSQLHIWCSIVVRTWRWGHAEARENSWVAEISWE